MMRNIYLEGELGQKFGTSFQIEAPTVRDAFKCIEANNPEFRHYLMECHENEVGFTIDVADENIDYESELFMPLQTGDITVTPTPLGAKGAFKIIAAIVIIVVMIHQPQLFATFAEGTAKASMTWGTATGLSWAGYAAGFLAVSLLNIGLMELMAPDPAVDTDQESSYLFNGAQQNIIEGDPVPLLYGRLRVPGQPVGFEIAGINMTATTNWYGGQGESGDADIVMGSTTTVER
tara:strand:- start:1138 stop:1839 length:702 start_codon:yes stop_codon:yes gene_type:complete